MSVSLSSKQVKSCGLSNHSISTLRRKFHKPKRKGYPQKEFLDFSFHVEPTFYLQPREVLPKAGAALFSWCTPHPPTYEMANTYSLFLLPALHASSNYLLRTDSELIFFTEKNPHTRPGRFFGHLSDHTCWDIHSNLSGTSFYSHVHLQTYCQTELYKVQIVKKSSNDLTSDQSSSLRSHIQWRERGTLSFDLKSYHLTFFELFELYTTLLLRSFKNIED